MPSRYERRPGARKYKDFSEADLNEALEECVQGSLSIRAAAEKYGIPKSTIHRKYHGRHIKKPGGQTVFSTIDENHILNGLLISAKWHIPFTPMGVRKMVKCFLDRKGVNIRKFKDNMPGYDWLKSFLKRHKDKLSILSMRLCENVKRARSNITPEIINNYFDCLEDSLKDIKPENLINFDETNVTDDPGQELVIVRKGTKHTERVIDATKSSTSVMFAIAGNGNLLPVYVVYKSKNVYDNWTEGGPEGAIYNCSQSGWFDSNIFESWFNKVAFDYLRKLDGPKAIIGDNLGSHLSLSVIEKCEKYNIRFILLPPNSTHLTQPLDVSFFRPFKRAWKSTLLDWKKKHRGPLPKAHFPKQLKTALDAIEDVRKNAVSGFKACGLIPLDRNEILKRLPTPSTVHDYEGTQWCAAFEESIQVTHTNNVQPLRQTRKKKNKVPPGKSITKAALVENDTVNEDVNVEETEVEPHTELPQETEEKSRKKTAKKSERKTEEKSKNKTAEKSENETGENSKNKTEEKSENETRENFENKTEETYNSTGQVNIEDFILCNFTYNESTKKETVKQFVCQVISISQKNQFEVKCMRYNPQYKCYVFPVVDDINIVNKNQVAKKVSNYTYKRGRLFMALTTK